MLFATPISQQLVTHVAAWIEYATGDGCADCNEDARTHCDFCPGPCQACRCCAQPTTVTLEPLAIVSPSGLPEMGHGPPGDPHSSGYVVLLFRPPIG